MAALSPTVGDVRPIGNTNTVTLVRSGEAIAQLQPVYLKSSDQRYWRGDNNGSLATAAILGVAITKADAAEDYFYMMSAGNMDPGTTVVVATEYCLGTTAGTIEPKADLANPENYTRIGYGVSANDLKIDIAVSAVVVP